MKYYLAFDVGGTATKVGVVTDEATVVHHEKLENPETFDKLIGGMAETYHRLKESYKIEGIGISSCGCIQPEGGPIGGYMAPSVFYMRGRDYYEICPMVDVPVRAENDGNASALGEYWAGGAGKYKSFITLLLGTGLGSSIFIDGKLFRGHHAFAGEIGYISPTPHGPGFSQLASPVDYERKYLMTTGEKKYLSEMYATKETDPAAARIWQEFIGNVAHICILLQFTIDPEQIFIGGGISTRVPMQELLQEAIDEEMARLTFDFNRPEVSICSGGNDVNLLGAVYSLKERYGI